MKRRSFLESITVSFLALLGLRTAKASVEKPCVADFCRQRGGEIQFLGMMDDFAKKTLKAQGAPKDFRFTRYYLVQIGEDTRAVVGHIDYCPGHAIGWTSPVMFSMKERFNDCDEFLRVMKCRILGAWKDLEECVQKHFRLDSDE